LLAGLSTKYKMVSWIGLKRDCRRLQTDMGKSQDFDRGPYELVGNSEDDKKNGLSMEGETLQKIYKKND